MRILLAIKIAKWNYVEKKTRACTCTITPIFCCHDALCLASSLRVHESTHVAPGRVSIADETISYM